MNSQRSTLPRYDIIGDVHGDLDSLHQLLDRLGYVDHGDERGHSHPEGRTIVFVGDLIDRGPDSRGVLHLVREMVSAGHALITMGNHEYNFVTYHTPDGNGGYLRPHFEKNVRAVDATLKSFEGYESEIGEFVEWMRALPFFLELDGLRIVHASWIDADIDYLRDKTLADDAFLAESARKGSQADRAIENVLKGVELRLPDEVSFVTHDGNVRDELRVRWWELLAGRPWREIGFPERSEYPLTLAHGRDLEAIQAYPESAPPVLFGHYKLVGEVPRLESPQVATLDYGAGHGGPATAYRWDGERHLDAEKFVQTSPRKEAGQYEVFVDANYHFMDEDERYRSGVFSSYDDALARARQIVDRSLQEVFEPGKSAADLEASYKMFGEDPWIKPTPEGTEHFSARDYAEIRAAELTAAANLTEPRDD